jgi:alpha-glucosidase
MSRFKQLQLKIKYFLGSLFYLSYAPKAWIYSRQRDRLERQLQQSQETVKHPGKLLQAEATQSGAHFYFEHAELEFCFLTPDFVRVTWKPGIPAIPYAIARQDWQGVEATLEQEDDRWKLTSAALHIVVSVDGSLQFCDPAGQTLREVLPPQCQGERWIDQAQLRPDEHIYGLGERAFPLNLRTARDEQHQPKTFRMWNYDAAGKYGPGSDPMYICIPLYLGLHTAGSYLIFYENTYESRFTFSEVATADFEGGALQYYLAVGEPAQLLERYTELTGRSPLPPRWALGYHQSRWSFRSDEAMIRDTVKGFKDHNLPISAVHLDIDVQVGFRAFTIDPDRFPQLASFTQELAAEGVQFITILNPGIKHSRHSNLFLEGQILDAFCKLPDGSLLIAPVWPGWCVFPDFTKPVVREWWTRQYAYLLDVGVAGFWHDMNEPAAFILWGDRSLPKVTQHYLEGRGGDHREAHNVYGLLQSQAGYESLRRYHPERRPFIVSRAGWAGLQRYAWTWTGDVECSWAALRQTISTVIGLGLSGIPYSGPDIGGFQGNPGPELYLRWFQCASFFTFYRTHSSNNVEHRTPWVYGEPTLSIIRQFLQLRYRLLPYFYTLSWEAAQKGYPPVRPVFWAQGDDPALWNIDDAFCLGDALLVCPILQPNARSRQVTLPKGHWYHFWDDALLEGPGQVDLEAPLERIPLLVRSGSILPMEENQQLILHLYPPEHGVSDAQLYSDAGDGYGDWRLETFHLTRHEDGLELTWEQQGDYPFPYISVQLHLHGADVHQAWVDGREALCQENRLMTERFRQVYLRTSI